MYQLTIHNPLPCNAKGEPVVLEGDRDLFSPPPYKGVSFTGVQVTPYRLLSSAVKHDMYCHFARRAYEHYYAQFRVGHRVSGLSAALGFYLLEKARITADGKLPHIHRALENAWSTLITNCRDTDISLIARALHQID